MKPPFFIAPLIFSVLIACKGNDDGVTPSTTPTSNQTDISGLKDVCPFPIGAAIDPNLLRTSSDYNNLLNKEMSSITIENAMKWNWLRPTKETFNFKDADYIIDYAKQQGKRLHGHVLLWHTSNPKWFTEMQGDSADYENLMKTHIQTVLGRYKDKLTSVDVVNEALNSKGTLRNNEGGSDINYPESSIWRQKLGPDYIVRAFKYAREAAPNVLLFYNEYDLEDNVAKRNGLVALIKDLKAKGAPIDGVGIQSHINVNTTNDGIAKCMSEIAALGLKVHISELDIMANTTYNTSSYVYANDVAGQAKQREKYKYLVQTYLSAIPKSQQHGITFWNVTDADSWVLTYIKVPDGPLLFDKFYYRKSAYYGFVEGLK